MRKRIFLMLIITFALCPNLYAAPALPGLMDIAQPDGSIIKARQQGDEFQHWTETKSGYTILRNPKTKYWDYAEPDTNGRLKSSGYRAMPQGFAPLHISPRLKPPRNKTLEQHRQENLNKAYQERLKGTSSASSSSSSPSPSAQLTGGGDWTPMPVTGEKKLLLVLVNFSDRNLVTTPASWESTVFSLDAADKSVARYYADNSFSALAVSPAAHSQPGSPSGVISVTISAPHPDADEAYATETNILNLALGQAATSVDFSAFDINSNGSLEQSELTIYFIYAGYEASGGNKTPSVWAHAWGGPDVKAGVKNVTDWAISGELNDFGRQHPMGMITHELGHAFCGLPDLYDTSYINAGMGIFSLMAAGSWGADSSEDAGTTPTALDLWSREYLGWAAPVEPGSVHAITIHPSLFAPDSGYKLQTPVSASEYYLLENRHPAGWDLGARFALGASWKGGLLLSHIDITAGTAGFNDINNSMATGGRQGVSPVEASSAICNMLLTDCWGNATTLFYAGNNGAWRPLDAPNSNYYDGTPTDFSLTGISLPGTAMTADWSTTPVPLLPVIDDFEDGDFTQLPWLTSGDSSWKVTASGYHSVYAAEAPTALADRQSSTLQTAVSTETPGYVSFRYAVDSEFTYDFLIFFIDGVEKGRWSGSVDWSRAVYTLEAGNHTLTWKYAKDESDSSGLDTAWIDDLTFPARYELNVLLAGNGSVTTDVGTLIWTGSTGSATYDSGTVVTLSAHANPGAVFTSWGGACNGSGTCEVMMAAARNVTATFASFVHKSDQSITAIDFAPASLTVNHTTTASAAATSGLPVTLTSITPATCTISGSTVTGLSAGVCTIAANQAGNATYNPAPPLTQDIIVGNLYGDLNDDNETTAADALLALLMAIGRKPVDLKADLAPLLNGSPVPDSKVTAADALVILRKAVDLW